MGGGLVKVGVRGGVSCQVRGGYPARRRGGRMEG